MPDSDGGAAAGHPYTDHMDPKTAALFDRMPADADLSFELKLLRTALAELTSDVSRKEILQIISIVIRAVQVRLKQGAAVSDLERLLCETAEETLAEMEQGDE